MEIINALSTGGDLATFVVLYFLIKHDTEIKQMRTELHDLKVKR